MPLRHVVNVNEKMSAIIFLFTNPVLAAGLLQALGGAAAVINAIAMVAVFGGLVSATVSALSERGLAGVKVSLVIAAICALAWLICQAFFAAGGNAPNIQMGAIN
jgi:hypothetical protein